MRPCGHWYQSMMACWVGWIMFHGGGPHGVTSQNSVTLQSGTCLTTEVSICNVLAMHAV